VNVLYGRPLSKDNLLFEYLNKGKFLTPSLIDTMILSLDIFIVEYIFFVS